jgi:hypothetical protein
MAEGGIIEAQDKKDEIQYYPNRQRQMHLPLNRF